MMSHFRTANDDVSYTIGTNGEPGRISAAFTDDSGRVVLRLVENAFEGSPDTWDIE
jgi:hypothetical protein